MKRWINDNNEFAANPLYWDGKCIINPTDEQYLLAGYHEYIPAQPVTQEPEQILPTIEDLVVSALRNGADGGKTYSINQECEALRLRDEEPERFAAYNTRVKECIAWANEQPHREEVES